MNLQTGNTQDCANKIYEALMDEKVDVAEPIDVDSLESGFLSGIFSEHDALIVGTPTWNTNADTFRSGTGWDDLYYDKLPELKAILTGKKVAVFGLGDQVSYGENYADAAGELYSVFRGLGCNMVSCAHTTQEGYDHKTSKSILSGTDKFCGLLLDQINQDDLTDDRIAKWIAQLILGGFFDASGAASSSVTDQETLVFGADINEEQVASSFLEEQSPASISVLTVGNNFIPHYNPVTGRTMWTSPDGRTSYVTTGTANKVTNEKWSP
jgi:flavodoxin I